MPTYAYECQKCGHKFERFQGMSDPPVKKCPECKGEVQRVIGTGAGIFFKGSGFHATDYKRPAGAPACGHDRPCCGRETRCDSPPCKD